MPRVTNAPATRKRRKKVLSRAKGYFGNKSRLYNYAREQVRHSDTYAYQHRRNRKSDMRKLWIVRINAAVRPLGISYSRFMSGLKALGIEMDRKQLSELAIHDEAAFAALVEKAKAAPSANA